MTFAIHKGEFFSLLGPSGCGKTTTLRLIAGFEQPDQGTLKIDDLDVCGVPPHQRNVNTVFQSYALFPHLNVFENIAFGLRRRRVPQATITAEVARCLDLVRLGDFGQRRISQLSGGQQQRVALARALINQPAVLLLDEPMAALDSQLKKEMRRELKSLQRRLGITFVLVTHDQEEALTMSDRVAVLDGGKLQQVSPPEELYRRPVNRFVAQFIGSANFLPVQSSAGQLLFEGHTVLRGEPPPEAGRYCWMLRPESLRLGSPAEGENALPGQLLDTTFVGPILRHRVVVGHEVTLVVEESSCHRAPLPSGTVQVCWPSGVGSLLADE